MVALLNVAVHIGGAPATAVLDLKGGGMHRPADFVENTFVEGCWGSESHYLTSERRRESNPTTMGMTIQITVVEPSIAHSFTVFVAPSRSATCV